MSTRLENIARIRTLLDSPFGQSPNLHRIVQQELSEEVDIINELNNTGKPWITDSTTLTSNGTQDTYEMSVSNFGKPLYVVKETNNIYQPYIYVPFGDLTSQNYGQVWSYGQGVIQSDPTIEKMSFYRQGMTNQSYKVKIEPVPQTPTTYIISYLPGYMGTDDPLEATIAIPEHATLVQLRAATALLPYCQWFEDDAKNSMKRKELMESFAYQLNRKEQLFSKYIKNLIIPKMVDADSDWR